VNVHLQFGGHRILDLPLHLNSAKINTLMSLKLTGLPPPAHYAYNMSGHCHGEHDLSGHGHDHAGHDHSDDISPAIQHSLYQHINFDDITTLNEAESDSGKAIIKKTWAERLEEQPELESDADEQLLMHVPYVCRLPMRGASTNRTAVSPVKSSSTQ
jgi:hypothetical protein